MATAENDFNNQPVPQTFWNTNGSGYTTAPVSLKGAPAQAKNQVRITSATSVIWDSTRPRGITMCGSCASSDASATVSMVTSHHNAYGTAPRTPDHPIGKTGVVNIRSSDTPGITATKKQTRAPIAAHVSQSMMAACSFTPMYCTIKNTTAQTMAQSVVVSWPGCSGFSRKAT